MCHSTKHNATIEKAHEAFIVDVARLAIANLEPSERASCEARIVYGVGRPGVRGTTFFETWQGNGSTDSRIPIVEVCMLHEESLVQVAGTTVHEIGHVLAGLKAGHGKAWKEACDRLGLRRAMAAGMRYSLAAFEPRLREYVAKHAFRDGKPVFFDGSDLTTNLPTSRTTAPRPCSQGIGTRGGTSRGKGSGSRMRKYICDCEPPVIIRTARDDLNATCNDCGSNFEGPVTQG